MFDVVCKLKIVLYFEIFINNLIYYLWQLKFFLFIFE